jgi:hypothetical protein
VPFHLPLVVPYAATRLDTVCRVSVLSMTIFNRIQCCPCKVRNHENAINRRDRMINIAAGLSASGQSFLAEPWQFGRKSRNQLYFFPIHQRGSRQTSKRNIDIHHMLFSTTSARRSPSTLNPFGPPFCQLAPHGR